MMDERDLRREKRQPRYGRFGKVWGTLLVIAAIIVVLFLFPPW
jgi:hypothetical protein